MQPLLVGLISLHVLPGVFWAGSSLALARPRAVGGGLAYPQLVAALVTIVAGGSMWRMTHRGMFGPAEKVLAVGATCALAAFILQVAALIIARRARTVAGDNNVPAAGMFAQRLAVGLLVVTVLCMATARYI